MTGVGRVEVWRGDVRLTCYTEGFIHFVASMTAPVASHWSGCRVGLAPTLPAKTSSTLRLDRDVLEWLRAQGKGYQTLINQVLRAWYEAQIKRARLTLPAKLAAKKHKVELSAEERREAASWKKVYAAAAKRKAKRAAAKPAAPAK
jgi:uncharacterized protein (DUF4415 family)